MLELGLLVDQILLTAPVVVILVILLVGGDGRGPGGGPELGLETWRRGLWQLLGVVDSVLALAAIVWPLFVETGIVGHVDGGKIDV